MLKRKMEDELGVWKRLCEELSNISCLVFEN